MATPVFLDQDRNEITFRRANGRKILFGEADGTLADFLARMRQDFEERGIDLTFLPTIANGES